MIIELGEPIGFEEFEKGIENESKEIVDRSSYRAKGIELGTSGEETVIHVRTANSNPHAER